MAFSWNDTIDETTDWSALDFQQAFWSALNERCTVTSTWVGGAFPSTVQIPSAGDDIQCGLRQAYVGSTIVFSVAYMQAFLHGLISHFVDPRATFHGAATITGMDRSTFHAAAGLHADGFTRKFPREFESMASTLYTDSYENAANISENHNGTAFSDGDVARCLQDVKIYDRVSGAWVESEATSPDLVVTHNSVMKVGDYIGPWIWNELRQALNVLVWSVFVTTSAYIPGTTATGKEKQVSGTGTNYADAIANVITAWAGAVWTNDNPLESITGGRESPPSAYARKVRHEVTIKIVHPAKRVVEVYEKTKAAYYAPYDAQGDGMIEDHYALATTHGPSSVAGGFAYTSST